MTTSPSRITALLESIQTVCKEASYHYGLPMYGPMNAGHRERLEKVVEEWVAGNKAESQR